MSIGHQQSLILQGFRTHYNGIDTARNGLVTLVHDFLHGPPLGIIGIVCRRYLGECTFRVCTICYCDLCKALSNEIVKLDRFAKVVALLLVATTAACKNGIGRGKGTSLIPRQLDGSFGIISVLIIDNTTRLDCCFKASFFTELTLSRINGRFSKLNGTTLKERYECCCCFVNG
jgi:hypothetical protein